MDRAVLFLKNFFGDRIQAMTVIIVTCFVSLMLLSSQSGASYPTYVLAIMMLGTLPQWRDVFGIRQLRWAIALLAWLSMSAFWSDPFTLRDAVSVWIRALLVVCFVIAVAECQLRGQLQRWMGKALVTVGAVAMAVALIDFYVTNPPDGRLNGLGQLDTHVVASLVYGVVMIFGLRLWVTNTAVLWRSLAATSVMLAIVCVFLSDSRTAWVSVILGGATYLLAQRIADPRQLVITLVAMVLIGSAVFLVMLANDGVREFLLPRGDSFRILIWSHVLERVAESPLMGLGITTPDDVHAGGRVFLHPHNMYLAVLYQGGLIGVALYLTLVFTTLIALLKFYEHDDAKLALSILTLASSAYVLDGHELVDKLGDTWLLIWLPISIAIGLCWRPSHIGFLLSDGTST